jgi:glycosyltransferase involved in cell wall biosynthesis
MTNEPDAARKAVAQQEATESVSASAVLGPAVTASPVLISVIVPVYNEEQSLPELVRRLGAVAASLGASYGWDFILVDDGSTDRSLIVARDLMRADTRLRVVELRRNYGQSAALQAGFDAASGAIVISMDGDLQHFPEEIPKFLAALEQGADVVCGWRHQRQEGIVRRWPSLVANHLLRRVSGLSIHDIGTTFRAYRMEILRDIHLMGEHHRFLPVFAHLAGARIVEQPIANVERQHGHSNYGFSRTFTVLADLLSLTFLVRYVSHPMRLFGKLALTLFGLASFIAAVLAYVWLETGRAVVRDHSGWFLAALMLYMSALQIALAGVLSEILVRVYFSKEGKPTYHIRQIWTSSGAQNRAAT